jgi:methylmalonyl-CoA mutase N-terminal domain/subunit
VTKEAYRRQLARLKSIRAKRNRRKFEKALAALRKAAEGTENTMPYIVDAVRAEATLGEICDTLREVFGTWEEPLLY